jgi:type I restriction enzyme S subunit
MVIAAQNTNQKPGYKQTEVGMIPGDWEVCSLGDVVTKVGSGITPTGGEKVYKKEGRPFLRSQNVGWGHLLIDDITFIDEETHNSFLATEIKLNDVLLNITGASIGRSAVADDRLLGGNVNQHVCIIRTDASKLNPYYLNFFLLSANGQKQIDSFQAGGNRQGLNFEQIKSFLITLPSPPEQQAIATALSDVDALIRSLDRLIAKKRNIKQATMQQLLTGKTRLPGFSGEWEAKKVGEILRVCHGKSQNGVVVNDGKYPILATGGEIGRTNDYLYNKPSVLIGRKGTIDSPQYIDTPFWTIDTLFYTEISDRVHPRFVFYLFNMIDWLRYNEASGVPSLNASTIENIEVQCPSYLEQRAIATVLFDMDAEIAALEQKLEKLRALKQGMMQELLTGKTRLI